MSGVKISFKTHSKAGICAIPYLSVDKGYSSEIHLSY